MEEVHILVDRARQLTLHRSKENHVDQFDETVDRHIQEIYHAICSSEGLKRKFLNYTQNELGPKDRPVSESLESLDAFRGYMRSVKSCAEGPLAELDTQYSLSNYFVSSSHNTYLTGNQLYSDAAAGAYTSVSRSSLPFVISTEWITEPLASCGTDQAPVANGLSV